MCKAPNSAQTHLTKIPADGEGIKRPDALGPWEDASLAPEERLKAYTDLIREKL